MLIGSLSHYFFGISIFLTSLFLILLVLVQRGRGGGIAGALGGAGGQSAFGTKAGDLFTRITVGVASFWILLCCTSIFFLKPTKFSTGYSGSSLQSDDKGTTTGDGAGTTNSSGATNSTTPSANDNSTNLVLPEVTTIPGATAPASTNSTAGATSDSAPPLPGSTAPAANPATTETTPPAVTAPPATGPASPTENPASPTENPATPPAAAPTTGDGGTAPQPTTPNN